MAVSTSTASPSLSSVPTVSDSLADQLLAASTASPVAEGQFLRPSSPLKRRRAADGAKNTVTNQELLKSPSPIGTRQPTGAGEMAEQKRRRLDKPKQHSQQTSQNPQAEALNALTASPKTSTSKPGDAPALAAICLNEPVAALAPQISISGRKSGGTSALASPVSAASIGATDNAGAPSISTAAQEVASPGQMGDDDGQDDAPGDADNALTVDQATSNKAFSYPGPLHLAQMDAKRGMSLPGSSLRDVSRSPSTSNKKHKCPYCLTEFTRHHNLKSHLLTHSHEKPYLCQQCDSRFRRLHDLKRHTKLHTGERPHVCPKCNRSFARGDALARHNKGQSGCAGRRSSIGSYGGDGTPGEELEGMVYANEASDEPENMVEDEAAGTSVPSIRHYDAALAPTKAETQPVQNRQPSTYPPPAARAYMGSGLRPPAPSHGGSSGGPSPAGSGSSHQGFQQQGTSYPPANILGGPPPMTESPKPLSPGQHQPLSAGDPHNRSPSLSSALGQNYGRRTHQRATPPPLPPPPTHSGGPHLPSLPGLAPPDPRYTLHSQPGGGGSLPQPTGGSYPGQGVRTSSNSLSSHGSHPHSSGDRATLPFGTEDRVFALVKSLESKVERLEEEVRFLRGQLQQQQQQQAPQGAVQAPVPPPR
ncbi:MAG: hypothetical protein LQ340_007139 [Diploschistes diacapsis]|nr:MAG: hypothetical protein LQ340_007139 [Diploschistes diacapsis]